MKIALLVAGIVGLLLTIVPPVLYFAARIDHEAAKTGMTVGMVVWFATVIAHAVVKRMAANASKA